MNEERLYDYSKGLNAPYWIQEIKTKKGHSTMVLCDTHACCPFSLSLSSSLWPMLLFGGFIFVPLAKITQLNFLSCSIGISLNKLAKFYTEYEPHGKKMHVFIGRLPDLLLGF